MKKRVLYGLLFVVLGLNLYVGAEIYFASAQAAEKNNLYQQMDIALDPFPYNGGTTSCDAIWMGVPVISLAGNLAVSRAGLSILSNIGLPELVARSEEEYIQIAKDLAGDLPRLSQLRGSLRAKMTASSLMDAKGFAANMESLYREIWNKWCATGRTE
jgi:predicted O-linked N-acetylglucosamine transferase (SPINDLY family)